MSQDWILRKMDAQNMSIVLLDISTRFSLVPYFLFEVNWYYGQVTCKCVKRKRFHYTLAIDWKTTSWQGRAFTSATLIKATNNKIEMFPFQFFVAIISFCLF